MTQTSTTIGQTITGRDTTSGLTYTGRVTEVIPPMRYTGDYGNRYRLADTGEFYSNGRPVEPIVE